ncbi:hypothetical protein TX23_04375 [Pseudomonas paralactis]|uniref:Uncharacterized protein n=1 Tax=Pseudomonas paralactis TaxID=1615673 RepID=A0A0R3AKX1_9PSED|nr:hypothetical protein TX23_04375 [Pseudomonas paralactis]
MVVVSLISIVNVCQLMRLSQCWWWKVKGLCSVTSVRVSVPSSLTGLSFAYLLGLTAAGLGDLKVLTDLLKGVAL